MKNLNQVMHEVNIKTEIDANEKLIQGLRKLSAKIYKEEMPFSMSQNHQQQVNDSVDLLTDLLKSANDELRSQLLRE